MDLLDLIVFGLDWIGGMFFGAIVFTVVFVPLFHGLPMSLYWSLKGRLRFSSTLRYVLAPVFWLFLFLMLGFTLFSFWPRFGDHLEKSFAANVGSLVGFVLTLFRSFSHSGRTDLREDFWSAMERYQK